MNPGAGYAGVISWSLGESRERLVLHPCIYERVFLLTLLQISFTTFINASGNPDHHSIAKCCKELIRRSSAALIFV
ncbi:hypothetical protein Niako_2621 [Niastella koreensis GR20-10]|uniref:Uncharacterized protein n=1 Tax=Niastella koreensis (strain DSM 17620 / KACC 11465 / NBRC 106392 / GR20-10) TaxID=700598 RepID=G8TR47_NIAKG|nr:hypothetical protein Niako_2621 [Niastella koreensis GR20-10]